MSKKENETEKVVIVLILGLIIGWSLGQFIQIHQINRGFSVDANGVSKCPFGYFPKVISVTINEEKIESCVSYSIKFGD